MRILAIHGALDHSNLGDVAMLQAAVERLAALWPGAEIRVPTNEPDKLRHFCPSVMPLNPRGMRHLGGLRAGEFGAALQNADLLVLAGSGVITDAFELEASRVLEAIEFAIERGIPTAAIGQGFGPVRSRALGELAKRVLPRVNAIHLRDADESRIFLDDVGVERERVAITGDDAVEIAFRERRAATGDSLGLSLRVAEYSGIQIETMKLVSDTLTSVGSGARIQGIAIATGPADSDLRALECVLNACCDLEPATTPSEVIRRIGGCRVMVAGSYHAAVFALAQGIPAIGLAQSDYYRAKFGGLAGLFGEGCAVLDPSDNDFRARLARETERMWDAAAHLRLGLLSAAERQIQSGHRAYQRLRHLVAPVPAPLAAISTS